MKSKLTLHGSCCNPKILRAQYRSIEDLLIHTVCCPLPSYTRVRVGSGQMLCQASSVAAAEPAVSPAGTKPVTGQL